MAQRIKEALKKLEAKVSGQPEKDMANTADYLEEIAEEYSGGGAGGSAKYAHLYISNDSYPTHITFQCDDASVATYEDLVNYLNDKGFVSTPDNSVCIALPASGQHRFSGESTQPVIGLTIAADYGTEDYSLYILDGENLVPVASEGTFEITFLGE